MENGSECSIAFLLNYRQTAYLLLPFVNNNDVNINDERSDNELLCEHLQNFSNFHFD